jgi:cholinesterase
VLDAYAGLDFGPSSDGRTVYKDYPAPLAEGRFARVPALIGLDAVEGEAHTRRWIVAAGAHVPGDRDPAGTARAMASFLECKTERTVAARARLALPTWMYRYAGAFANQENALLGRGPWHGSEVGLVFGTNALVRNVSDTKEQAELGRKMREAWTAFAKDPEQALDRLKWPRYRPIGRPRYSPLSRFSI